MDQPQPCTKCHQLPEDILMLACSHDLCLNCAAQRLNFEMKKRKPANSIVCQFCYERTPLDKESIEALEKMIPTTQPATLSRSYLEKTPAQQPKPYEKSSRPNEDSQYSKKSYGGNNPVESTTNLQRDYSLSSSNMQLISGISSRKNCAEHVDEDISYFCFTCKCECICPECVIHGKHKDHDVKTIKKSHPIVKSELQSSLDKIQSNIENLLIRKNEVQKNIRLLTEQNSQSKRQIQQAFEDIRSKLDIQERDILSRCDSQLSEAILELEKSTKQVLKRIDELKGYSTATIEFMKKDQQTMLNFYAKKWKEISQETRDANVNVPTISLPNNEKILGGILDLSDAVEKLGATNGGRR